MKLVTLQQLGFKYFNKKYGEQQANLYKVTLSAKIFTTVRTVRYNGSINFGLPSRRYNDLILVSEVRFAKSHRLQWKSLTS